LEILREKAKTLKVVGIAWGETPVAMIEDTTTRETFFLKALQSIGGIRVKAVLKDRVILSYENAEHDLF
jgi:DNA-binding transcriptional regulator LsrR (DeoR family)